MYKATDNRYDQMTYRRCGASGLKLSAVALGLWRNFGADRPYENSRAILRAAFDGGITYIDLANNYGVPYGSAEETFGRVMREDFRPYRDELIIATKAGYDMWPGPYGNFGSKKYLVASLDQSLGRMGLDYVDIFYHHRPDPDTPLEETMDALATVIRQGKALYAGISNYGPEDSARAAALLAGMGVKLLVHQPRYSMLHRLPEEGLFDVLREKQVGAVAFSPLAQGLLTDRYLGGIPEGSRGAMNPENFRAQITEERLEIVRALNRLAEKRGQSLAQMAVAWILRREEIASVIVGASSVAQLENNLGALQNLAFSPDELREIDRLLENSAK